MAVSEQDKEKIESFVVRNTGYYRDKWRKFHGKPGSMVSFNWAACLGQFVWLAYRRLYLPLILVVVFSVTYVSIWLYVEERQLVSDSLSEVWNWFFSFLWFAVFGFLGNYWYWRKFRKVERRAASMQSDRDAQLRFIRSAGGTSPIGASLVVVILLMPVLWALYWGVYQASRLDYSSFVFDATGPLTIAEIEANFLNLMDEPLTGKRRECVINELQDRARAAGDPETLDPATVELLPAKEWGRLDADGKRLILTQVIATSAFFACNRSNNNTMASSSTMKSPMASKALIVTGDPRFDVFELSNSAGDGAFASADGTVLMSFLGKDSRYCRAARFSSDYTVVLACRNEDGWEIEATSSLVPGESTVATNFGGGDMTEVTEAIQTLNSGADFLDEREIIEAASKGWR